MSNDISLSPLASRLISIIKWKYPGRGGFNKATEQTGISKSTWSQINTGRQDPGGKTLEAVCQLYPEYAFWLMTGRIDPEHGHTSPDLEQLEQLKKKVSGEV